MYVVNVLLAKCKANADTAQGRTPEDPPLPLFCILLLLGCKYDGFLVAFAFVFKG